MWQEVQATAGLEQPHQVHPREQLLRLHRLQQQLPDREKPRETHQHRSRAGTVLSLHRVYLKMKVFGLLVAT